MSKDRVKFMLSDTQDQKHMNIKAASRAFGISQSVARGLFVRGSLVICRPSQFARFIIYRVEEGITVNRIRQLKPKLFTPEHSCEPFDVSKNHDNCDD